MFNFPFMGYPYNYQYYKNYNNYIKNSEQKIQKENSVTNSNKISNTVNQTQESNNEQAVFSIMGINLYLDDLLILGVLFFLYQQKVHDEMLYIILILLLLS